MDRLSQPEVLEQLVRTGRLTDSEAELVEKAPRFSLPTREIVGYLGGLLVLVGAARLVIAVSVVNYVVRKVDNEVLQGVTIVATGLTVLVGAMQVFKNREHQGRLRSRVGPPTSSTRRSGHGA